MKLLPRSAAQLFKESATYTLWHSQIISAILCSQQKRFKRWAVFTCYRAGCFSINTQKKNTKFRNENIIHSLVLTANLLLLPILHSHRDSKHCLCTFSTDGTRLLFANSPWPILLQTQRVYGAFNIMWFCRSPIVWVIHKIFLSSFLHHGAFDGEKIDFTEYGERHWMFQRKEEVLLFMDNRYSSDKEKWMRNNSVWGLRTELYSI